MTTATTITNRPTSPLPPAAVSAMASLEQALNPVIAEHHRIEQLVAGLRIGETAVINGTPVTAISLAEDVALSTPKVREAVATYRTAAKRASALVIEADLNRMTDLDADSLAAAEDLMAGSLAILAEAGIAHLVAPGRAKAGA